MTNVFVLVLCISIAGATSAVFAFSLLWFLNDLIPRGEPMSGDRASPTA